MFYFFKKILMKLFQLFIIKNLDNIACNNDIGVQFEFYISLISFYIYYWLLLNSQFFSFFKSSWIFIIYYFSNFPYTLMMWHVINHITCMLSVSLDFR